MLSTASTTLLLVVLSAPAAEPTAVPFDEHVMQARERIGLPPFAVDDIGQPRERRGAEFDAARSAFRPNELMIAHRIYQQNTRRYRTSLLPAAKVRRNQMRFLSRVWQYDPELAIGMAVDTGSQSRSSGVANR